MYVILFLTAILHQLSIWHNLFCQTENNSLKILGGSLCVVRSIAHMIIVMIKTFRKLASSHSSTSTCAALCFRSISEKWYLCYIRKSRMRKSYSTNPQDERASLLYRFFCNFLFENVPCSVFFFSWRGNVCRLLCLN